MEFFNSKKDFLELENDGKNDYYILEKGTKIYRGDSNKDITDNSRFFTNKIEYAKVYGKGIVYEYTVNNELNLLAVDKNINDFYDDAPAEDNQNIKKILRENYGYISKNRLSESKNDNKLVNYICENSEYHGYAADEMNMLLSHFDPEIVICNPKENLSKAIRLDTGMSEKDIENANRDAKLIGNSVKTLREEKKQQNRPPTRLGTPPKIDYGSDDESYDNRIKPEKLPFGGKRKSKRKTVKKKTIKPKFWRDMKPSKKGRKTYKKKYGSRCFLLPSQLKYPVCDKKTGKMNCKGLLAANYRAALSIRRKLKPKTYSYRKITQKARKLAKKHKCNWVKSKSKSKSKSKK